MTLVTNEGIKELFASEARIADVTSEEFKNHYHKGILILFDVTALALTPSVVPTIQTRIGPSTWVDIILGTAITATGEFSLLVYPGAVGGAFTDVIGAFLPSVWRLFMDHGDTDSITYSVNQQMLK